MFSRNLHTFFKRKFTGKFVHHRVIPSDSMNLSSVKCGVFIFALKNIFQKKCWTRFFLFVGGCACVLVKPSKPMGCVKPFISNETFSGCREGHTFLTIFFVSFFLYFLFYFYIFV